MKRLRLVFHLAPVAMLVGFCGGVALQPAKVSAEAKLHTGRTGQKEKAKVVFFLTSGLEDVEQMRISLAHAKVARQSGFLGDVGLPARTLEEVHAGPLLASIDRGWDERRQVRETLDAHVPALQERARETARIALGALEGDPGRSAGA